MSGDPKENLMLFKVWVDFNPKQPDDKQVSICFAAPPLPLPSCHLNNVGDLGWRGPQAGMCRRTRRRQRTVVSCYNIVVTYKEHGVDV